MSVPAGQRRADIHRWGPRALVIATLVVVLGITAYRHHVFSSFEAIYFAVLIPSIILHEISHGVVAYWFGDDTAKVSGRLSLNPIRHIDPIGTIVLPIALTFLGAPAFGWAKPVPVNVSRLRHPRNESVLVALAGPVLNIALAVIAGLALRIVTHSGATLFSDNALPAWTEWLFAFGEANVVIAVFNLIPIPPLDGSAFVERLLPTSALPSYYRLRPYAMLFVLALVLFDQGLLSSLFNHAFDIWARIWIPQA